MSEQVAEHSSEDFVLTKEKLMGSPSRWRRLGVPVAAGERTHDDGTPDYGLFGPSSVVWKVILHPATIIYQTVAQFSMQLMYKPIVAGVRDADPLATKVRAGTLTAFDSFERFQRNSGLHAPMWLGDTRSAETIWAHLHALHAHVKGGLIDVGQPELGKYHADGPRDVMWAALTEMMGMLWMYENFAWHGDTPPQQLPDDERDQEDRHHEHHAGLRQGLRRTGSATDSEELAPDPANGRRCSGRVLQQADEPRHRFVSDLSADLGRRLGRGETSRNGREFEEGAA